MQQTLDHLAYTTADSIQGSLTNWNNGEPWDGDQVGKFVGFLQEEINKLMANI